MSLLRERVHAANHVCRPASRVIRLENIHRLVVVNEGAAIRDEKLLRSHVKGWRSVAGICVKRNDANHRAGI